MRQLVPIRKGKSIFDEVETMRDRIMRRAYDIFTSNGGLFGKNTEDWIQEQFIIRVLSLDSDASKRCNLGPDL